MFILILGVEDVILTLLIGAIVGIGVTLRMYWEKLKYKFIKKEKN